jgi:hypothetical protein
VKLAIGEGLSLPVDAVTQTFGIIAVRGVGKTHTASVLVEEMIEAQLPVIVVDPVGVWWGLRSSADGERAGLPVVILGGEHADVPLEVGAGAVVADFVIESRQPAVLDLSLFRKAEQVRFMTDFAERLYLKNREALHLVIDEADAFAPQKPMKGAERLLGAIEDLVRRGRARGLGLTLITQRAAVLNKNVLTQISVLVALRTVSPQDRAAIDEWVRAHATTEQRDEMMASLPSLPIGTAWFWSPGWLDLFQRVQVRRRRTLDSSATPKVGAQRPTPKALADVDLVELRERLAETIERAKEDDPKALRARIVELEKGAPAKVERVEVPALTPEDKAVAEALRIAIDGANAAFEQIGVLCADLMKKLDAHLWSTNFIPTQIASSDRLPTVKPEKVVRRDLKPANAPQLKPEVEWPKIAPPHPALAPASGDGKLKRGARNMLDVLVRHHPTRLSRGVLAARAGMSESGTFGDYLGALRQQGLIETDGRGMLAPSQAGLKRSGAKPGTPMSRAEVLAVWQKATKAGARRMLGIVLGNPAGVSREDLARLADMSNSGTFGDYLGFLRKHLLVADGSPIKLGPALEGTR